MNDFTIGDITFTGIAAWFAGVFFVLVVLIVGLLLCVEMVWKHFALKERKRLAELWDKIHGDKK